MSDIANNRSPLEEALESYKKELDQRIQQASSKREASGKNYASSLLQLQNKTCSLLKYQEASTLYQNVDQCIAISTHQSAQLIKANVGSVSTLTEQLQKELSTLSKTLKKTKTEVYTVKEDACNLVECCLDKEEHENKSTYDALIDGVDDIRSQLDHIKSKSETANNTATLSFNAVIDVAGIQGFVDMNALKDYSEDLCASLTGFKDNVQSTQTSLGESIGTCLESRTVILINTHNQQHANFDDCCVENALCDTWETACNECNNHDPRQGQDELKEICEKLKDAIDDGGSNNTNKLNRPKAGPLY